MFETIICMQNNVKKSMGRKMHCGRNHSLPQSWKHGLAWWLQWAFMNCLKFLTTGQASGSWLCQHFLLQWTDRFTVILTHLHFSGSNSDTQRWPSLWQNLQGAAPSQCLESKFKERYSLHPMQIIDEDMIAQKGRQASNKYNTCQWSP